MRTTSHSQVTHSFCKDFLHFLLALVGPDGELPVTEVMTRLFEKEGKTRSLSQAYHRYALNYINALTYLESLRRHQDFSDFEKVCFNLLLSYILSDSRYLNSLAEYDLGRTHDCFDLRVVYMVDLESA